MEKIIDGDCIELNGKEFACMGELKCQNKEYILLVSTKSPVEVKFAFQTVLGEEIDIEIIDDVNLIKELSVIASNKYNYKLYN